MSIQARLHCLLKRLVFYNEPNGLVRRSWCTGLRARTAVALLLLSIALSTAGPVSVESAPSYTPLPSPIAPAPLIPGPDKRGDAQQKMRYVPGELIVKFKPGVSVDVDKRTTSSTSVNSLLSTLQVTKVEPLYYWSANKERREAYGLDRYYKITVRQDIDIETLVNKLMQSPDVELAAPNYLFQLYRAPNDEHFSGQNGQWALNDSRAAKLHVQEAWDITTGSSDIVVAVLDTGVDVSHPDLASKNTHTGVSFCGDSSEVDSDGHGTAVAGIIAAESNNGIGVAGMSWGARIMPVKVSCSGDAHLRGIVWARDLGARIINISFVYNDPIDHSTFGAFQDAINYAYDDNKGAVIVVSAGNRRQYLDTSDSTLWVYGEMNHVITVGATNIIDPENWTTC